MDAARQPYRRPRLVVLALVVAAVGILAAVGVRVAPDAVERFTTAEGADTTPVVEDQPPEREPESEP